MLPHPPSPPVVPSPTLYMRGLLALRNNDAEDAASLLTRALTREPDHRGARRNLVRALLLAERWDQVVMHANAALSRTPDDAEPHFALGTALNALGQHSQACAAFARALSLRPDHAASWLNMGNASADLDDLESAETLYRTSIRLDPALPEAHASLGYILTRQGRLTEAMQACETAIGLIPNFGPAHWNLATAALLSGDLTRGFAEYEWRKRHPRYGSDFPPLPGPAWDGSDPAGQTILIRAEQGFGDTIQFARYLPAIAAMGGKPVLICHKSLMPLIGAMQGVTVCAHGQTPPAYDSWIDMASLPFAFGTTIDTIPYPNAYLRADPLRSAAWAGRLPAGRKIGVVFSGNPHHPANRRRSIPLEQVRLPESPCISFVDLHVGDTVAPPRRYPTMTTPDAAAPSKVITARAGPPSTPPSGPAAPRSAPHMTNRGRGDVVIIEPRLRLPDLTPWMTDYAETAALIDNLDLVITVDTSVAHLAGALGKPVWILLPHAPDWRWCLGRSDSPWYPSARLFRQLVAGDWASVLDQVFNALILTP